VADDGYGGEGSHSGKEDSPIVDILSCRLVFDSSLLIGDAVSGGRSGWGEDTEQEEASRRRSFNP